MISGESPLTAVLTMRASGWRPSWAAFVSDMITSAAAPSLSGQQLPAVTVPSGRKTGFSADTLSRVTPARGPVVSGDHRPVAERHRGDVARPEAVSDGALRPILAAYGEGVLVGT